MRSAALLTILMVLSGCSAEKRLQRLIAKHPELSRVDTITVVDTVYIPGDTLWRQVLLRQTDTVRIENDRQSVRVVRIPTGSPCDTAAIALDVLAEVKPDTVYHTVTVEVDRIVPCPEGTRVSSWWRAVALFFLVVCIALFLLLRYPPNK
jgi:hypothetical protein